LTKAFHLDPVQYDKLLLALPGRECDAASVPAEPRLADYAIVGFARDFIDHDAIARSVPQNISRPALRAESEIDLGYRSLKLALVGVQHYHLVSVRRGSIRRVLAIGAEQDPVAQTFVGPAFHSVSDGVFFQAEDGIRDWSVTGVQTCALPI